MRFEFFSEFLKVFVAPYWFDASSIFFVVWFRQSNYEVFQTLPVILSIAK
jgi:hypothetical protein